jgi:hypothetical protein
MHSTELNVAVGSLIRPRVPMHKQQPNRALERPGARGGLRIERAWRVP